MKQKPPETLAKFPNRRRTPDFGHALVSMLLPYRRVMVTVLQVGFVILSNYFAFWLRFDGRIPDLYYQIWLHTLLVAVVIRSATFIPFRLYEGLWRYSSIHDLKNIVAAALSGSALVAIVQFAASWPLYPRSIYFVDSLLLIFMMGGSRLGRRLYREMNRTPGGRRILIYGAGDAGEMIVRDMYNHPSYDLEPVGFIDDNNNKVGERIHGVPVLGTRQELAMILRATKPTEILIAMPTADPTTLRTVVRALSHVKIPIKTLPSLQDILHGKVTVEQIRTLAIEDLLPRIPVNLDPAPVLTLIEGKCVLITGAGGSIGSELARQAASMRPKWLILVDRYENGLHEIYVELVAAWPGLGVHVIVGDITDFARMSETVRTHKPQILFHAAAHKHVPLMEQNPCEAIKNNVRGTRLLAEIAETNGVEQFILISTDKAVNPTSVMGASKRVAELITQARTLKTTDFIVVRFGNVLASNGSVIPHFLKQIKRGGPVTVTHPDMKRYFMLIPEAAQLVLQAAAMGQPESIYILDMGNEFGVLDMARNLIRLCGRIPHDEIPIVFTGLRPGEKLSEELVGENETVETSSVERVSRIRSILSIEDRADIEQKIERLERYAFEENVSAVLYCLTDLVPTYKLTRNAESIQKTAARA